MSSRIARCPQCGQIGQHQILEGGTAEWLKSLVLHPGLRASKWEAQACYCVPCDTPYVIVWPAGFTAEGRKAIVQDWANPLRILEGGGG